MTNQEHVVILRQSVKVWNIWRRQHPDIHPDLSHAYLIYSNLSDANLSDTKLISADFVSTNLSGTNLSGADFSGANLSETNLSYAKLWGTILGNVDLRTVKGLDTIQHEGGTLNYWH